VVPVRDAVCFLNVVFEKVGIVQGHLFALKLAYGNGRKQQLEYFKNDLDEVFVAVEFCRAMMTARKKKEIHWSSRPKTKNESEKDATNIPNIYLHG
tara:strand:+ start:101 stop:388 length:288 start_codon:yes stop_codon:yes gene_type:complete